MKVIAFKGNIETICAGLKAEAQRYKGWTLENYIRLKKLEATERKQLNDGVTE